MTATSFRGVAESGTLDLELAIMFDAWPLLTPHTRAIIVGMARKAFEKDSKGNR